MIDYQPISKVGQDQAQADSPIAPVQHHTHDGVNSPLIDKANLPVGGDISATFVIGPVSNSDSAGYDYVTDGTDDDVQIQAAIDALPSTGGRIVFREGTYTLGSATVTIAKNGVTLQGQGKGSIITCKTNFNVSFFTLGHASTQYTNCVIKDFYFDGNHSNQNSGDYIIDNFTSSVSVSNVLVEGCYFTASEVASVICKSTTLNMSIRSCTFENWKAATVAIEAENDMRIIDCYFTTTSTTGKCINGEAEITGCKFLLPAGYNTTAIAGANSLVSCFVEGGGTAGSSCILVDDVERISGCRISVGTTSNASSVAIRNCQNVAANFISGGMLYTNDGEITGNTIGNTNGDYSLTIDDNAHCDVSGNTISTGDVGAILLASTDTSIISGNRLGEGTYSIREESSSVGPNIIIGNKAIGVISAQNPLTEVSHNIED